MSDESEHIEVTEDGEIVARHVDGEVGAQPDVLGYWWVRAENYESELVILPTATLAAWCRRVLWTIDGPPQGVANGR